MSEPAEDVVHLVRRGARRKADVEERAALELDARPEAADREKDDAGHDQQRAREEVPPLALDDLEKHRLDRRRGAGLAALARLGRTLLDAVERPPPEPHELDRAVQENLRDDDRREEGDRDTDAERQREALHRPVARG